MSGFDANDTIAAIASPAGTGLRGIVRLSGDEAWTIALAGFEADDDRPPPVRAGPLPGTYPWCNIYTRVCLT